MHEGVWSTVRGLFSLMTIAVLILPLSKKVKIPYTVLLALFGIPVNSLNLNLFYQSQHTHKFKFY